MADAQAKACPVCGGPPEVRDEVPGEAYVACSAPRGDGCMLMGPNGVTATEAIAAWNKLASVEPVDGGAWGEPLRFSVEFIGNGPDESPFGTITDAEGTLIAESAAGASEEVLGQMGRMVDCHNALARLDPEALGEFVEAATSRTACEDHGSMDAREGCSYCDDATAADERFSRALAKLRREEA